MGRQGERTGKSRRIDRYGERLKKRRDQLSPGLVTVADYIDGHRHAVLSKSALEIAFDTGTSDATVIRAIQALGFRGLIDLKETLKAYLGETDSPSRKWPRPPMTSAAIAISPWISCWKTSRLR